CRNRSTAGSGRRPALTRAGRRRGRPRTSPWQRRLRRPRARLPPDRALEPPQRPSDGTARALEATGRRSGRAVREPERGDPKSCGTEAPGGKSLEDGCLGQWAVHVELHREREELPARVEVERDERREPVLLREPDAFAAWRHAVVVAVPA